MTNMVEPQHAVNRDDADRSDSIQDGELTTLVRRWMAAGAATGTTVGNRAGSKVPDRVRRDSTLRVLPETVAVDPEDIGDPADPEDSEDIGESAEVIELPNPEGDAAREEQNVSPGSPTLPRRTTGTESVPVRRTALLVDARRESADAVTGLLARLAGRSSVTLCRAYGDWTRSDLGEWVGSMRRDVLHSFHHFADDDEQALVAMAIDAVDIARDAGVDEVVLAGDLTSSLPLVHRLHAAGVRVVAAGAAHTPHDVRAACDEFIDTEYIDADTVLPIGRHRA